MKWEKAQELVNFRVKLRPLPRRFDGNLELERLDDVWIVQRVEPKVAVELSNVRTGHVAKLGADHIHHFTTDPQSDHDGLKHAILDLDVELTLKGNSISIEPVRRRPASKPTDKWVDIGYAKDAGIQAKLEGEGFQVRWSAESKLSRKVDLEGWEIVTEVDKDGTLCTFKVKDRVANLVLVKKRV